MKWVAIIGSRDYANPGLVVGTVQAMVAKHGKEAFGIVSGGARGVDRVGVEEADRLGVHTKVFKPDKNNQSIVKALKERNSQIVQKADIVIAFWDGKSRGTMNAVFKAKRWGKKVIVFDEHGNKVEEDRWVNPDAKL
jgi:hypothetical protein